MFSHSKLERFRVSKEKLKILGSEFNSEALPMLEKLYQTSFWILLGKKFAKKIVRQTFMEAIENCNVTKNEADWQSWILRIWMREILDFYSTKENDTQTIFDFIDHAEITSEQVSSFTNSENLKSIMYERELLKSLQKLPAVLRIPLIMKEVHSFNYEKIAELIDVPNGVIATRIYRARKLLFLLNRDNYCYEEEKSKWDQRESAKKIFELRKCALLIDDELVQEEKTAFSNSIKNDIQFEDEIRIQQEIKKLLLSCSAGLPPIKRIKSRIERKAEKKFNPG